MDTTGDPITIALATVQQEIGVSQPVFALPFVEYEFFTSPCWIKEVWQFLHSICEAFTICSSWTPPPTYSKDINLVESIMDWDIPNTKKHTINMCRLYQKVNYIGDLYDASGTRLKQSILHFNGNNHHDDKFTSMTLPKKFKEYWDFVLRKLTTEYPTASKLGYLLHGKSFLHRMSEDMQWIFEYKDGKRKRVYRMIPSTCKELSYVKVNVQVQPLHMQDFYATTTEVFGDRPFLKLKHFKKNHILPDTPLFRSSYKLNNLLQTTSKLEIETFDKIIKTYDASIIPATCTCAQ